MENEKITAFILEYTKGVDLINCVNNSIENNFEKPEDYESFGCKIGFITKDKTSVQDQKTLLEWNAQHHNAFVVKKIDTDAPTGFGFPPPYNFVAEEDITINSADDAMAEVAVGTNNGTYLIKVEPSGDNEYGMAIRSVHMKLTWGGGLIPIIE